MPNVFLIGGVALVLFCLCIIGCYLIAKERRLSASLREEMTRRKEAEATLLRAQRLETIGKFTGHVAHDFNNLLTAIIGNVEMALINKAKPARLEHNLTQAHAATTRAAKQIQKLLAYARKQHLNPHPLLLNKSIEDSVSVLESGHNLTVRLGLDPLVKYCMVDADQFDAALTNLLVNARDAMSQDGMISVATSLSRIGDLEFAMVAVTDSGSGMSREVIEHAFEPFFTTKGAGNGTGLGLSQVQGFSEQSGGSTTIRTEVGYGTTITMYLPVTEENCRVIAA